VRASANLQKRSRSTARHLRRLPLVADDDQETVQKAAFLYDALYAALLRRHGG